MNSNDESERAESIAPLDGKPVFTFKGEWKAGMDYAKFDVVRIEEHHYVAVENHLSSRAFSDDVSKWNRKKLPGKGQEERLQNAIKEGRVLEGPRGRIDARISTQQDIDEIADVVDKIHQLEVRGTGPYDFSLLSRGGNIRTLIFSGHIQIDKSFDQLFELKSVRRIHIGKNVRLIEDGADALARCSGVTRIQMYNSLEEVGIQFLSELSMLEHLYLSSQSEISVKDLDTLLDLENLESVHYPEFSELEEAYFHSRLPARQVELQEVREQIETHGNLGRFADGNW
jgi:hypothetical protein